MDSNTISKHFHFRPFHITLIRANKNGFILIMYYIPQMADREKVSKHLAASKWINQVLVIKKTSNENVLLEEKCKNVSNKKISLVKVVDF